VCTSKDKLFEAGAVISPEYGMNVSVSNGRISKLGHFLAYECQEQVELFRYAIWHYI